MSLVLTPTHSQPAQFDCKENQGAAAREEKLTGRSRLYKNPLMSHGDSGWWSLGPGPETGPAEPIHVRGERAKRITGSCISNGPSRNKKWKETEMKKKKRQNNCILKAQERRVAKGE